MVGKSNRLSQKYKVIRPYDVIFGTPNEQTQNQCQSLIRWLFINMDLWIYGRFCLIMFEGATQELRNVAIARNFITSSPLPSIQRCCLHRSILDNITNCPLNAMKKNLYSNDAKRYSHLVNINLWSDPKRTQLVSVQWSTKRQRKIN